MCNISVGLDLSSKRQLVLRIVECKAMCSLFCQCTFYVLIIIFRDIILAFSNFKIPIFFIKYFLPRMTLLRHSRHLDSEEGHLTLGEVPPLPIESEAG